MFAFVGKMRGEILRWLRPHPLRRMALNRTTLLVTRAKRKVYKLEPEKGVNLPALELRVYALIEEDIAHLDFVAAHADVIGYALVQTPEDVRCLIGKLEGWMKARPLPVLMIEIETPLVLPNLSRLMVQAGARIPVAVILPSRLAWSACRKFTKRSSGCARLPMSQWSGRHWFSRVLSRRESPPAPMSRMRPWHCVLSACCLTRAFSW